MSPARRTSASAALGLAALLGVGLARADEPRSPPAAPATKPAAAPATKPAAAPATKPAAAPAAPPAADVTVAKPETPAEPTIAPPAPNASPEKVEKAKDVAKAAALTPIVPSPGDATKPAFQLYAQVDLPVVGVGIIFAAARFFRSQKAYCAPLCDPRELNVLDRTTAGWWSPTWSTASDIGLYSLVLGAAATLIADEGVLNALNDSVVIAESALIATAVSSVVTLAAGRPRPYLYGNKAPLSERNSPDASFSFVSSHASVSFAIATSTFMAMRRLEPKSKLPFLVLGLGGAGAVFVAGARVAAGKHFITDSLAGAVIGTSIGVLIPAMHASPVRVVPVVGDTHKGVAFTGLF